MLSSDSNQAFVKYSESSFWKRISSKSTPQNLSAVHQKVEPMSSNWVTSVKKLAWLNLLNFTSKCASWETSKESSKSVQCSELRTHSPTDTCASSLVWISKWPLRNIIMSFWTSLVNFSHTCSNSWPRDTTENSKPSMNSSNLSHSNAKFQLLSLLSKRV